MSAEDRTHPSTEEAFVKALTRVAESINRRLDDHPALKVEPNGNEGLSRLERMVVRNQLVGDWLFLSLIIELDRDPLRAGARVKRSLLAIAAKSDDEWNRELASEESADGSQSTRVPTLADLDARQKRREARERCRRRSSIIQR